MRKNKICGIYKITNKINGKAYIGQSVDIKGRFISHKCSKDDLPLHQDIRKLGKDNFEWEILEECAEFELNDKEEYWIEHYDTFNNGYNGNLGGCNPIPLKLDYNKLVEIEELLKQGYGNLYIANLYNVSENIICGINTGYYWYRDNIQYPIKVKQNIPIDEKKSGKNSLCSMCGEPIWSNSKYCMKCNGIRHRKVERPNKDELHKILIDNLGNFTAVGKLFDVNDNTVRKWCKQYNLPFHTSDYKPIKTTKQNAYRFIVNQIDKAGNIIGTYESIEEAHRVTGIHHIGQAANPNITSRKTAGGYYWEIVEKVQTNLKENA